MTNASQFKKGDRVYMISGPYLSDDDLNVGRALLCARYVTLTSLGKRQGTAEYNDESGRHIKERIYTDYAHFERTREAVLEFAHTNILESFRETAKRVISNNERDFAGKEWAEVQNNALRGPLAIRVWIHNGSTVENIIVNEKNKID